MARRGPAAGLKRAALLACLGLLLNGCGWLNDDRGIFVDRRDDYLTVEENPDLVLPEDLGSAAIGDPYPIPPTPTQSNPAYYPNKPPLPDAIYGDDSSETVRIQRLGERQWLVVPEPPATLWPKVKQFFAENGVAIAAENPAAGRLDTDWLLLEPFGYRDIVRTVLVETRDGSTPDQTAERLVLRVEQGLKDRTAELHLRHQRLAPEQVPVAAPSPVAIDQLRSINEDTEQKVLAELGAYVAAKVSEQAFSMVGRSITAEPKAIMQRLPSGEPALRLNLDEERAFATIGQALTNAEIEIEKADAEALEYLVAVTEEDFTGEKPGFLGRLFRVGSRAETVRLKLIPIPDERAFYTLVERPDAEADREFAQAVLVLVREYAG
ncbi:MAG: outer membrane protein assembly factor BamC [Pseudomonadota bacterium]